MAYTDTTAAISSHNTQMNTLRAQHGNYRGYPPADFVLPTDPDKFASRLYNDSTHQWMKFHDIDTQLVLTQERLNKLETSLDALLKGQELAGGYLEALTHKEDNTNATQRNRDAVYNGDPLYVIPVASSVNGKTIYKLPEMFPKTVEKFLLMSDDTLLQLLEEYKIITQNFQNYSDSMSDISTATEIIPSRQQLPQHRHTFMLHLARHFSLRLHKLKPKQGSKAEDELRRLIAVMESS